MAERPVVKRDDMHPDMYQALLEQSGKDERSLSGQAVWYIKLGLERQAAIDAVMTEGRVKEALRLIRAALEALDA